MLIIVILFHLAHTFKEIYEQRNSKLTSLFANCLCSLVFYDPLLSKWPAELLVLNFLVLKVLFSTRQEQQKWICDPLTSITLYNKVIFCRKYVAEMQLDPYTSSPE